MANHAKIITEWARPTTSPATLFVGASILSTTALANLSEDAAARRIIATCCARSRSIG